VRRTVERMLAQQEPYPLVVMNSHYDVVLMNHAAQRLFTHLLGERAQRLPAPPNSLQIAFDPDGLRPLIQNWESMARQLLLRLQREIIQRPADAELKRLLSCLCSYPDVPTDWHIPDLETPSNATFHFHIHLGEHHYGFLTALTVFNAPQNITVEELRLESYFPLDEVTEALCRRLAT
jgi:hypothetical protein